MWFDSTRAIFQVFSCEHLPFFPGRNRNMKTKKMPGERDFYIYVMCSVLLLCGLAIIV